jgi:probable rRNA maturation factor
MKRAYLILDSSYSRSWKKDHKSLIEKSIAQSLTFFLEEKNLFDHLLIIRIKGTNNAVIRKFNKSYRGQDKATNVLSFENLSWESPLLLEQLLEDKNSLYLLEEKKIKAINKIPSNKKILDLGNIVLSFEKIEEESQKGKKPFLHYLAFITLHGLLHLLGFDHEEDEEALIMSKAEKKIMRKISSNFLSNDL